MKIRITTWTLAACLALSANAVFAQDQQQQPSPLDPNAPLQPLTPAGGAVYPGHRPPIGAARGVESQYDPQTYDPSAVAPDQNTLAGAAPLTLGSLQHDRNIFDPSISLSQLAQTYPLSDGKSVVTGASLANASLNFDRTWSEYHFFTIYNGGWSYNYAFNPQAANSGQVQPSYQFHTLTVSQDIDWGRWRLLLRDDFAASPGATFTGQGMGGPGLAAQFSSLLGSSLTTLGQSFEPSESINTSNAMRYRNAVLGQMEYSFSRRSAITLAGSYGLLHFTAPGFFSSTMINAQAGYDYALDPWNSLAILGSYGRISYTGTTNSTMDYTGAVAYGRKITGRLAFQVAAGPQEIQSTGGPLGNFRLLFASANSSLIYQRRRSGLSLAFARGLTEGSGLFQGATSDTISANAHYQFTHFWSGSINGGYAVNDGLAPTGSKTAQFDNWFVGANVGRRLGTHAQFNLNYGAQEQLNPSFCTLATCGVTGLQQSVGVSVNWHLRRLEYE